MRSYEIVGFKEVRWKSDFEKGCVDMASCGWSLESMELMCLVGKWGLS